MSKPETLFDEYHFAQDKYITKNLEEGEKIYLSTLVDKFNHRGKKQQRILLVTNRYIYNVSVPNILTDLFATVSPSVLINRKIAYSKVSGITVSTLKREFTIHIPSEHDYRLNTEKRDVVLEMVTKAYIEATKKTHLAFYYKNEMSTIDYTTTKLDLKKNFDRRPREKPEFHDLITLKKKNDEINNDLSNSGVLYSSSKANVSIDDFNFLKVLGRGAFGKVTLVEKKDTKEIYALKSLRKEVIIQKDQLEHTKMEKRILSYVYHPFLVRLMWAFQTQEKIFFVMQFLRGGELFTHLKVSRRFNEERTRFYAAEILLALEYLHENNIIYRDLKPENLLLDEEGHICLTDFGLARFIPPDQKATTFVGTPEYLAPELILNKGHGKPADWWSLGSVIYEMMVGIPPFYNKNQNFMFQLIKEGQLKFPSQLTISETAQDLITKLLDKNPESRLGMSGSEDIKKHPWFSGIDWAALSEKKVQPPFKPKLSGKLDVDNFDDEFTSENPMNSMLTSSQLKLVEKHKKEFEYFDGEFDEEFDREAEMKALYQNEIIKNNPKEMKK